MAEGEKGTHDNRVLLGCGFVHSTMLCVLLAFSSYLGLTVKNFRPQKHGVSSEHRLSVSLNFVLLDLFAYLFMYLLGRACACQSVCMKFTGQLAVLDILLHYIYLVICLFAGEGIYLP